MSPVVVNCENFSLSAGAEPSVYWMHLGCNNIAHNAVSSNCLDTHNRHTHSTYSMYGSPSALYGYVCVCLEQTKIGRPAQLDFSLLVIYQNIYNEHIYSPQARVIEAATSPYTHTHNHISHTLSISLNIFCMCVFCVASVAGAARSSGRITYIKVLEPDRKGIV